MSETPIDITSSLHDVVFTFTDRLGKITGDAKSADGRTFLPTLVLLFPVDRALWSDYGWASRRVWAGVGGVDGKFSIDMPPDGDYLLAAVPFDQTATLNPNAWAWRERISIRRDPRSLFESVAPIAERIHAREGDTITRTLTVKRP